MKNASSFGSLLPDVRGPIPGPGSKALGDRLAAVESWNITYSDEAWPVFWQEARGANVRDADGNVFLDLGAAFGVALLGHAHPEVVAAVDAQARLLLHGMGDVHPPAIKVHLLECLCGLMPWPAAKAVLASTGSEAVEIALKTAAVATGRPGVLAFEGAYHGLTLGSLATTERAHFRGGSVDRLYGGVAFAPFPGPDDAGEVMAFVRGVLADGAPNGDPIGAVIVEPVQGRAGARVPPDGFMAELSVAAHGVGALIIADEIFTGFGRCGAMLASHRVGLEPDMVCVGKAMGGGMPISACLARADVMDAWPESEGEAIHTSTFLGHPASCAAALAVLRATKAEDIVERARALGVQLLEGLRAGLEGVEGVGSIRGLGLLIGVEFVMEGGEPDRGRGARVARAALAEGLLVLPAGDYGEVVELTPPATITDEQRNFAVETMVRLIRAVP